MGLKKAYKKVFGSRTIGQAAAVTGKQIMKPYRAVYGSRSVPEALAVTAREVARVKAGLLDVADKLNVERHSVEVCLDDGPEDGTGLTPMTTDGVETDRGVQSATKIANTKGRANFAQSKITSTPSSTLHFNTMNADNAMSGMSIIDITPNIDTASLGAECTRRGNQVKLTGLHVDVRISIPRTYNESFPLGYTTYNRRVTYLNGAYGKMYIIKTHCNDVDADMVRKDFLNPSEDSGVVDSHSTRNYDHLQDYQIMCVKSFRIRSDPTKGHDMIDNGTGQYGLLASVDETTSAIPTIGAAFAQERPKTVIRKSLKLGQRLRWHKSTDIAPFNVKYFAVFVLDRGNIGSVTPDLADTANKPFRELAFPLQYTPLDAHGVFKWWYVDN